LLNITYYILVKGEKKPLETPINTGDTEDEKILSTSFLIPYYEFSNTFFIDEKRVF